MQMLGCCLAGILLSDALLKHCEASARLMLVPLVPLLLLLLLLLQGHTICALGDAAAWPVQGLIRHFRWNTGHQAP
jgi:hypothetical protein